MVATLKRKKSETDRRNVVFVAPNCELNSVNFYEKTLSCHYENRQLAPTPTTTLPPDRQPDTGKVRSEEK
jgi:hypothetical protein